MAMDLTVMLEDRPGELARVGEALGGAGINIEGVCGVGAGGRGVIHLLVQDGTAARQALEAAGISVESEAEALVTDMSSQADTPGSLGQAARAVADAGVNIVAMYIATHDRGVIVTSDNDGARRALGM